MNKRIAISSQNKKRITKHAGKCKNFLVYTINEKEIISEELVELKDEETLHSIFHGVGNITENFIFDCDMLLTGSIGPGAVRKLQNQGVEAYSVNERDPKKAIEDLIAGKLEVFNYQPDHSCNH